MDRANYVSLYAPPSDYNPPDDTSELRTNTEYPNLNSKEYRRKPINRSPTLHPFYEKFSINEENETILASNNLNGRICDGSIWGFKEFDNLGKEDKSCFVAHCDSPITNLSYIQNTLFILTTASGSVQLWSTKSDLRKICDFCLFLISERNEHNGLIMSMDLTLNDGTKAVTGSSDYCIKVWDIGADLSSTHTWRYAHSDCITGISASSDLEPIFVSCSRDKSALIWDYRQLRPAIGLYEDHSYAFTTVYWSKNNEKNNQIILGDESGKIFFIDSKMPNKIQSVHQIYNRPITKIACQGDRMVVLGNTIMIRAFKLKDNNDGIQLIYKNSNSTNFPRDVQWSMWTEKEFYTIAWSSGVSKHTIS